MKKLLLLFFIGLSFAMEKNNCKDEDEPTISDKAQKKGELICPICLGHIKESDVALTCEDVCEEGINKHVFHRRCLEQFLVHGTGIYGCPVCSRKLKSSCAKRYRRIYSDGEDDTTSPAMRLLLIEAAQLNAGLEEFLERIHDLERSLRPHRSRDELSDEGVGFPSCSIL